ncbi:M24 family metallopeptidase [Promethearchaeum syntrophicum]|uniref:M24 family metallopeptidase n=1 Tax=Promethearchaeum syntrophicum TaxID=2594042 RepID=A0A5B9DD35_9ARCH|nr:M24 family metallopeptidase [Candidatus Prometheoarchaeum syntrophicum]QEE16941.1 Xaa-Pro dipeptidase [Candidatus Prometheoarchaeum syntrophicum]
MENQEITKNYKKRRMRLLEIMGEGLAFITTSYASPDVLLYDKNLQYLVGKIPNDAVLLMAPKGIVIDRFETHNGPKVGRGRKVQEVLFVRNLLEQEKIINGEGHSISNLQEEKGIEVVKSLKDLNAVLKSNLVNENILWVNVANSPNLNKPLTPNLIKINQIRDRFSWLQIKNCAPLIHNMRWVKEPIEIEYLRNAFQIHSEIFTKIMQALKPRENESLGKAIYDYEIGIRPPKKVRGDWQDRYVANIIVAAGKNSAIAHYMDNNQTIQDGDLILIDAGVEYNGYCSDISRTFPANGKFTVRQKEIYKIVLEAQKAAIAVMKPGKTEKDAHYAAYEVFKKYNLDKYGYGRCGHSVGLNIHDATGWGIEEHPFEPGVVVVIEPFIAIPDENIGIRIEDGVLITENGAEVLQGPVKEIEDIEALCKRD